MVRVKTSYNQLFVRLERLYLPFIMLRCVLFAALCGVALSSYTVHTEKKTFEDAEAACASAGGHLATIQNAKDQALISKAINEKGTFWVGLRRNFPDMEYTWIDGTPVTFTNWDNPEAIREHMYTHGAIYNENNESRRYKWIATFGFRQHGFVCQN
ncbi:pulmonary surfactant-associated protein A-like [Tubulanus polymorphus]|uniref:pulmonary surfactant-associated protein A-like n=1 Tax=Tubulanus polymorphus TaxID=672921 RepID=UPI003DA5C8E0